MNEFLEFIKSSKDLLNKCLNDFSSLESDFLSANFTEEMKTEKLKEMRNGFRKLQNDFVTAESIPIKKKTNNKDKEPTLELLKDKFKIKSNGNNNIAKKDINEINSQKVRSYSNGSDSYHVNDCDVETFEYNNQIEQDCVIVQENEILRQILNPINDEDISSLENDNYKDLTKDCHIVLTRSDVPDHLLYGSNLDKTITDILHDNLVTEHSIGEITENECNNFDSNGSDHDLIIDGKENSNLNEILYADNSMPKDISVSLDNNEIQFSDLIKDLSTYADIDNIKKNNGKCNESDIYPEGHHKMIKCYVVLEDVAKIDRKGISEKEFFENLEKEVNKLSQIPRFSAKKLKNSDNKDKKSSTNKEHNRNKSSKIIQSGSEESGDNSESDCDDVVNVLGDDDPCMIDSPVFSDESDTESSNSDRDKETKAASNRPSVAQSDRSQRSLKRPMTRSLKMPVMSDLDSSNEEEVEILSSTSDKESDEVEDENTKKKKKTPKINRKNKKAKLDTDDEKEDDSEEVETRKNLHKIFTNSKLSESTKAAEQLELQRRKRMEDKQKMYNKSMTNKVDGSGSALVLEKDQNGESIVEVHEHITKNLKIHQIEAINFMYDCVIESVACLHKSQEEVDKPETKFSQSSVGGCILAHCMGLGKTLTLIGFMHTMLTTPILNLDSCIVVCPVNTAMNWKKELKMWIPTNRTISIFEAYGNGNKQSKVSIIQQWHSKGGILIIGYEMFRQLASGDSKTIRNKLMKQKIFEALVNPGPDFIVCDEGHLLKNEKSAISKIINQVKTKRRIVLTGTPLQNRLVEYHTMVHFVKPNLLGTQKEFMNRFVNPINNGQHINSTGYDVQIMKKRSHILFKTLDGCVHRRDYSALVKYLPPKYEYVIKIRMSEIQRQLYHAYLSLITISRHTLFQDQLSLSRIWTHPYIICMHQDRQEKKATQAESEKEEGFIDDSDEEIKDKTSKKPLKENNIISLVSDESDIERMEDIEKDSSAHSDEVITVKKTTSRTRGKVIGDSSDVEMAIPNEPDNVSTGQSEKHWWSDLIQPDHEKQIEISGKLTILFQILRKASDMGEKVLVFSQSLLVLDIIEKFMSDIHKLSTKNNKVSKLKDNESEATEGVKDFFSLEGYNTWVKGVDYDRMDGSTQLETRADIQNRFNSQKNKRLRLFLISTRAGGIGVNLVAASRVVIFDVSWNPSQDIQAIFRSYRFGQVKPVYVYRLVSQGTMEEKMYERQVTKLSLSLRVVDEQQIGRYFTEEDLRSLYKFEPDIYDPEKERETPILPKDRFLAELIQDFPQWILGYHEHDSLLQNNGEEELTEAERQEAWKEFEDEKTRGIRPIIINNPQQLSMTDFNQFGKAQLDIIKSHCPEYAPIFAANYANLLKYVVNQQPELMTNLKNLSIKIQAVFFQSLQRYKSTATSTNVPISTLSNGDNVTTIDISNDDDTTTNIL